MEFNMTFKPVGFLEGFPTLMIYFFKTRKKNFTNFTSIFLESDQKFGAREGGGGICKEGDILSE